MSPESTVARGRVLAAKDSASFARAPITSRLLPPAIIVGPTKQDEIEERIAAARTEGYEAGKAEVASAVLAETEAERTVAISSCCVALASAAATLAENRRQLLDEMIGEIAELALAIVGAAVGAAFEGEDELRERLAHALELVPEREEIVVRLHPEAQIGAEEIAAMVDGAAVTVISDADVELNGCIVEAGASRIDAQIGAVMARVERVFANLRNTNRGDQARRRERRRRP